MVSIEIKGLYNLNGFLIGLSRNLRKEINAESEKFLKDVKKSAMLRSPIDTGKLKNSIKVYSKGKNKWILSVGSREAVFQEEGFTPHFIFTSNNEVNGQPMETNKFWADGFHWVSKSTPFLRPALESNLGKLSQRLNNSTKKAIRRSEGGKK